MIVGDVVRLKEKPEAGTAVIQTFFGHEIEGRIWLETPLDGSRGWNIDDLEPAAVLFNRKDGE